MRPTPLCIVVVLAACGRDTVTVRGSLADSTAATAVWVDGGTERSEIANGAFELTAPGGDTLDLRFSRKGGGEARMLLESVPAGGTLRLDRIWFARDLSFPGDVQAEGSRPVIVNGLRVGARDAVPTDVDLSATVLAVSSEGDAMIVRPDEPTLPDLRVAVTPASILRTVAGEPFDADELTFGDSLRIAGRVESGYVIATGITVPRTVVSNEEGEDGAESGEPRGAEDRSEASRVGQEPSENGGAAASPVEERGGVLGRIFGGRGRGKGKGGENGKGGGKGKG